MIGDAQRGPQLAHRTGFEGACSFADSHAHQTAVVIGRLVNQAVQTALARLTRSA
jgi:hypothetical protein